MADRNTVRSFDAKSVSGSRSSEMIDLTIALSSSSTYSLATQARHAPNQLSRGFDQAVGSVKPHAVASHAAYAQTQLPVPAIAVLRTEAFLMR